MSAPGVLRGARRRLAEAFRVLWPARVQPRPIESADAATPLEPAPVDHLAIPELVAAAFVSSPDDEDLAFPAFAPRGDRAVGLPVPPQALWTVGEDFEGSGQRDAQRMIEVSSRAGLELAAGTAVLDFGCGPGRVIRWLPPEIDGWGVDINADRIAWCQSALSPPFRFACCSLHPHLPFADDSFDLIYAGSVFTHLGEMADSWLLELIRVARPGALLYLTIHDRRSIDFCRAVDPESPFRALTGWQPSPDREARFADWADRLGRDLDGFTMGRAYYAQVFYDRQALVEHWGRYAQVVDVVDDAFAWHQTAVVLRSPPA